MDWSIEDPGPGLWFRCRACGLLTDYAGRGPCGCGSHD